MKRFMLKLLVSAALLFLFLWRTPLDQVWEHLQRLDVVTLLVAAGLSLAAWGLSAIRLWFLLPEFSIQTLLRATFVSLFYGTILPGQVAGDLVKAYRLGRQSARAGHAEAATVADRAAAIFALFCLGAVAVMFASSIPGSLRLAMVGGALGLALCGLLLASSAFHSLVVSHGLLPGAGRSREFILHFAASLHECLRNPRRLLGNFLLALAFHLLCICVQIYLGRALGISLTLPEWTVVHAGVTVLVLLPLSLGGIGLREGGYTSLLALFGVVPSVALSLSFAIFGLALFGAAIGALLELRPLGVAANVTIEPKNERTNVR
jgi:uncharacterized protein (TIRG00374 family)